MAESFKLVVPEWLCDEICERYGSLETYERERWGGAFKIVRPYWDMKASESMQRVNRRLKNG